MRADKWLVARGHFDTRTQAQDAIRAGRVRVDGQTLTKPSTPIDENARVEARPAHPWVGRGGVKLDHALKHFALDVGGLHAVDIGASTGGFTDVLLSRGAASVHAVDVGTDQLHPRLREDDRVIVMENTDARALTQEMIGSPDLIVCDASFIPLAQVLPVPLALAGHGAHLIALIKPQFEVGRPHIGRGGIVRDEDARRQAVSDASAFLAAEGWEVRRFTDSPISGKGGNRETLIWAVKSG